MKKIFTAENTRERFTRSRWITVQHLYNVTPRHGLYDFASDENGDKPYQDKFNPENGLYLDCFRYNGRWYALEQFVGIGSMVCPGDQPEIKEDDGTTTRIHAVDFSGDLYRPLHAEFDECCERVRIYTPVKSAAWLPRD